MATLKEDLIGAGLPILDATESGTVEWVHGASITLEQMRICSDMILEHIDPARHLVLMRVKERYERAGGEALLATQIRTLTIEQAVAYIDSNVIDLPSAKAVLKIITRVLMALWDRTFPDHAE